jgi:hypothetical protein
MTAFLWFYSFSRRECKEGIFENHTAAFTDPQITLFINTFSSNISDVGLTGIYV